MGEARIIINTEKRKESLVLQDKKKKRRAKRIRGRKTDYVTVTKKYHEVEYNFLKYWRVVRYWVKKKYGLSQGELEVLLYLYDEALLPETCFSNSKDR